MLLFIHFYIINVGKDNQGRNWGGGRRGFILGHKILEGLIFIVYVFSKYIFIFFDDNVFRTQ